MVISFAIGAGALPKKAEQRPKVQRPKAFLQKKVEPPQEE